MSVPNCCPLRSRLRNRWCRSNPGTWERENGKIRTSHLGSLVRPSLLRTRSNEGYLMSEKGMRCAIYTRKSHAEGLDQAFNSLDAQREAGVDYVKSQKHEGWSVLRTHYDDGGYSGATMERPALKRLFEDIDCGAIDLVVVYKVDRLSRSIGDFAQMMERFDEHGVSFVSVTQQFNTTTSMGRLTLNMLLSFAQRRLSHAGPDAAYGIVKTHLATSPKRH